MRNGKVRRGCRWSANQASLTPTKVYLSQLQPELVAECAWSTPGDLWCAVRFKTRAHAITVNADNVARLQMASQSCLMTTTRFVAAVGNVNLLRNDVSGANKRPVNLGTVSAPSNTLEYLPTKIKVMESVSRPLEATTIGRHLRRTTATSKSKNIWIFRIYRGGRTG